MKSLIVPAVWILICLLRGDYYVCANYPNPVQVVNGTEIIGPKLGYNNVWAPQIMTHNITLTQILAILLNQYYMYRVNFTHYFITP